MIAGSVIERVLRPPKIAQERWLGSYNWRWSSITATVAFGLIFNLADALGRRVPLVTMLEQSWQPIYCSICFASALMMIRLDDWRQRKAARRGHNR